MPYRNLRAALADPQNRTCLSVDCPQEICLFGSPVDPSTYLTAILALPKWRDALRNTALQLAADGQVGVWDLGTITKYDNVLRMDMLNAPAQDDTVVMMFGAVVHQWFAYNVSCKLGRIVYHFKAPQDKPMMMGPVDPYDTVIPLDMITSDMFDRDLRIVSEDGPVMGLVDPYVRFVVVPLIGFQTTIAGQERRWRETANAHAESCRAPDIRLWMKEWLSRI